MPNHHLTDEPTVAEAVTEAPDDALWSSKQLAALMGVSLVTLSRWRSAGKGPPWIRLSSSRAAYSVGGFRAWVISQTVGSDD